MHSSDHELPHYIRVRLKPQPVTQQVVSAYTKTTEHHGHAVAMPKASSVQGATASKTRNFELF